MFLSEKFNALIEVTKAILFNRSNIYPPIRNRKQIENKLKVEFRKPEKPGGFYEVSVGFIGPWRNRLFLPRILWHTFNGYEDDVVTMVDICKAESEEFVTIFAYDMLPKPTIKFICPEIYPAYEEQSWILDLGKKGIPCSGEPSEAMIEILLKIHCLEGLDIKLAKNYQDFLNKTCFMFYDLTFNFLFCGQTFFVREGNLTVPLPWSTSRRLKKFFKYTLGEAESVGSTWVSQEEDNKDVQPFDFTVVNYGITGDGNCLPVWVLGPSGVPLPGFSKTFFMQMVCQAAALPLDLMDEQYKSPANLPPPDFCLQLPPQHSLAKRDNFLVIVLMLPIKHRKFTKHSGMIKYFDAVAARNWDPLVEVLSEVLQSPITTPEENSDKSVCRGIAAAFSAIIRKSLNTDFREKCFSHLEVISDFFILHINWGSADGLKVTKSIDGEDEIEEMLLEYLQEEQRKPGCTKYRLRLRVPESAREIMRRNREQVLEEKAARRKARADDPNNEDSDSDDGTSMALAYRQYHAERLPWPSSPDVDCRNKKRRFSESEPESAENSNQGPDSAENSNQGLESEENSNHGEENVENINQEPDSAENSNQGLESEENSNHGEKNVENINQKPVSENNDQGPENTENSNHGPGSMENSNHGQESLENSDRICTN